MNAYSYVNDSNSRVDMFGWEDIVYRALSQMDIKNIKAGLGRIPKNPFANALPIEHVLHE